MSARAKPSLVLSVWLIVVASSGLVEAERWSRQVSNSDWIPLASPRSQPGQPNLPPLPQAHQPLIPGSLPPELRQEYQQQLQQLQKTQESIQRLLLLQQELKAQQQLLQGQGYLPNGISESGENKQALQQGSVANAPTRPELSGQVLVPPPQLSGEATPPLFATQNFRGAQGETTGQEQYEDYGDRQPEDYRNAERPRESLRDKVKYVPESPTGPVNAGDGVNGGEEEVQVVYVPAEVLAQRGHSKNQRGRDRKQFGNPDGRPHHRQQQQQQRPFANQHGQSSVESTSRERENVPTTVSPQEEAYARDFLEQLQREHEGTDRLLKEARQKELDRLREERKEIQRQAKLQQAALEREQEIQRQREAEKKRKELAKLEETAKQRELERIREAREKQRQEELERAKKAQARANEEKRKAEEARQAEIDRLALLERQKKAEIERTIKAQKALERVQKEEEERAQEAERNASREKESSRHRVSQSEASPQAEPLIRSQHSHQQTHAAKYNRANRNRNKARQRQHHVNAQNMDSFEQSSHETTTAPPSPNQPPLAVFMINRGSDARIRVSDVLKTLKDAKTIDVLDNVGQDAPPVFVGPSDLRVPSDYVKFDLPYLSSIDNNRVERRVDKLPFFVAPLSFNPPPGYSKIPFPAPHIGSVVVNTLDHIPPAQPDGSFEDLREASLNPLIEPNSFLESSNHGLDFPSTFDRPAVTPSFSKFRQDEPSSTPRYQSTPSYSSVETSGPGSRGYRFRQPLSGEQSGSEEQQTHSKPSFREQSQPRPTFLEETPLPQSNHASQYSDESTESTTPVYGRPSVVSSFAFHEGPEPAVSSTPVYQESYSRVRQDSIGKHLDSQSSAENHDLPQHREVDHRYREESDRGQDYSSGQVDSGVNGYADTLRGPAQYNLPAQLPPIIPQLPGLVNSLLDESEQTDLANKQTPEPTTPPTTPPTTTTTTEAPRTTQRSRGRSRGRVVVTRPVTTTTTTQSPAAKARDPERPRRPISRSRSRFTTTTEEYRDAYEPTKSKVSHTTQRYNSPESYGRTSAAKSQKFKSRDPGGSVQASRNQFRNVHAHEADGADGSAALDPNSQLPEPIGVNPNEPAYPRYNFATSTTGLENYPVHAGEERTPITSPGEVDYSKNFNYPQAQSAPIDALGNQGEPIGQQYQQQFPVNEFGQPNLENAPVNGFNYQSTNEQVKATPTAPPTSRDYGLYQNKEENLPSTQDSAIPTEAPTNSQLREYQHPGAYEKLQDDGRAQTEELARPPAEFPINDDKTLSYGANDGAIYDSFAPENRDTLRTTGLAPQQAPLEITTEATTTASTTTEAAPVVIRQRVRGRFGARGRQDSHVQTKPRGSQDEYVRFSAVNNENTPTTERPTTRHRENARPRAKTRHQYHGTVQVRTEGNDFVRIQAPVRSYQKTIVTPPSSTQRTTTSPPAPATTTAQYQEEPSEGLEYGFIRPPNFAPIHPVDNRAQNLYRLADNQAQLQSIVPTDETAEDSILSHTQISRNRPKYQSPNRRPSTKPATTTTSAPEVSAYTERSRVRADEPKNNRIRVRGRKPGRRRTTTTTTTTTEYVLEDINDLPLEENYPRRAEPAQLPSNGDGGQGLYEEKFEALPLAAGGAPRNPVQQQSGDISYTGQDFVLNFGNEPASPEPDQTQLASQPPRKYGQAFGSRSRTYSTQRGSQDRDIHGAESQWSTKLTSNSFQPSPSGNRLPQGDQKSSGFPQSERKKYSEDRASADAPEIITAAPEDSSYVTVLVTSDDRGAKSVSDDATIAPAMEGNNYGMKTSLDSRSGGTLENTTPTAWTARGSKRPKSSLPTDLTTESGAKSGSENANDQGTGGAPTRRAGMRRRRVRVRVRPAPTDDFVTAESQHFGSAVNSLFHERVKLNHLSEQSREVTTTEQPSTTTEEVATTKTLEKVTTLEDFADETLKSLEKSSAASDASSSDRSEEVETSVKPGEVDAHRENEGSTVNNVTAVRSTEAFETNSSTSNDENSAESTTNAPITTSSTDGVPRKSWDSTKRYIDSIAMQSGEFVSNSKYRENASFEENPTGQSNEVFHNEYRENVATKGEHSNDKEDNNKENYPKNHRSEWSEVRYPSERGSFEYNRKVNLTGSQLPGVVTKSEGDTNVKTLSDYVKAIFDTMRNVDEERKSEEDDFSSTEPNVRATEGASTAINDSTSTEQLTDADSTTVSSIFDYSTVLDVSTESPEITEQSVKSESAETEKSESTEKQDELKEFNEFAERNEARVNENFDNSFGSEKEERTERPGDLDSVETTKSLESSTYVSTEGISSSSRALSSSPEGFSSEEPNNSSEPPSNDNPTTTTTENSPVAIASSKLGGVVRTSTTTKISHMTEICYRGRCVMTKPKKEFRER